jgi:hypothetical protein
MAFPRIIDFKFDITRVFEIPSHLAGNPGLISYELYESVDFYKPLCHANNIILAHGVRLGIRPVEEAYRNDMKSDGISDTKIEEEIQKMKDEITYSSKEWISNGSKISGYVTDLYAGRQLIVPSEESCVRWLGLYRDNG